MLKIIDPQFHGPYEATIDSLLGLFKIYQHFYLSFEAYDRATFLIAEDDKRGVYGGAVLYPQKSSSFLDVSTEDAREKKLGKLLSTFHPKREEYWKARICLCIGNDPTTSLFEQIDLCENFFRDIYKEFTAFGEREEINFLAVTFRHADRRFNNSFNMWTYKEWPLLEVKPSGEPDGYFHGVLSLKGHSFKRRNKNENFSLKTPPSFQNSLASGRAD